MARHKIFNPQTNSKRKTWEARLSLRYEEVFEPVTENQKQNQTKQEELSEKQMQALRDSTQTTTQAIKNQTRAIQHSSNILNKKWRDTSFKKWRDTRSSIHKQILKEKLGKQDFHYDTKKFLNPLPKTRNKTKQNKKNFPKSKCKRYVILLKQQHKQSKIRQEQYNTVVIF